MDEWSSLDIKKLLYFVRPRYRYASSPALLTAAVYFKSGSLFECRPEPGYHCGQYQGNQTNLTQRYRTRVMRFEPTLLYLLR